MVWSRQWQGVRSITDTLTEMDARAATRIAVGLLIASTLAGCVGGRSVPPNPVGPSTATTHSSGPVTLADAKHCPVTRPGRVGPKGVSADQFFGWGASYGNGKLWVGGLWPGGVIDGTGFVDAHDAVGMKFGWWRAVPGKLRITGRRLDASAPPAQASDRGPAGRDRPARLRALGGPDGPVRAAQLPVLQGLLPAVRVPVHIVSGAHDELVPPSNGRYLAERLPDSRLSILDMVTSPGSRSRPVRHHRRRMGGPRRGTIHPPLVERNTLQAPIEQPAAATGDRQRGRSPDDQSLPGLIVWEVQAREARPR